MEYKIIGGDGREYGPASLDELKSWVQDGRVGKDTLVWHSDTGAWTPALRLPEIEADLRRLYGVSNLHEPALRPVGFAPRFLAYFIDRIVLWIVFTILWSVIAKVFSIEQGPPPDARTLSDLLKYLNDSAPFIMKQMAVYLPLHLSYEVFLNGKFGATLGKMMIGARVVLADGSPITFRIAAFRWIAGRLSDMICYTGYLFIAFRRDKRALHDLLVGTQVVKPQ